MHILCIYQHYANFDCANSGRLFTFLRHLGKNHRISLISGDHWYSQRITDKYEWVPPGVKWLPVSVPYSNRMSSLQRVRAYGQFPLGAIRIGKRLQPDVIYAISTPLTTGWAADRISRAVGVPWVFEIRDIWPDFPIQMGAIKNGLVRKQLYRLERSLYDRASHVITVSPDMTDHVVAYGTDSSKVTTLLQGTNLDLADAALSEKQDPKFNFNDRKIVLYAGTFGRANAIPAILETARILQDRSDIVFVFTGEGFHDTDIRKASLTSSNVVMLPPVPRHRVLHLFRAATLSLVPFLSRPVLSTNSPAKFFDSLAVGTPVLVTNPGWTRRFVEEYSCGEYAPIDSPERIAEIILPLLDSSDKHRTMALNGMRVARENFDRIAMAGRLEEILAAAAAS